MAIARYARHSRLFSGEWLRLHPELLTWLKGFGIPLGIGALLAFAVLAIVRYEASFNLLW